jgi:LmbE family N-acetylglucosaminyl deacetylase
MTGLNLTTPHRSPSVHLARPIATRPLGSVLIVGAHADDACLGAGALASMLVSQGRRVVFITATDGRRGGYPAVRYQEDCDSAAILGVELVTWNLPDCRMSSQAAIELLASAVNEFSPEIILVHFGVDSHQDHRKLSAAANSVGRRAPSLLYYEGPTTRGFRPSLVLDVSSHWKRKLAALEAHKSQMSRGNYLEWADSVARFRAWPQFRASRCEAFAVHHADLFSLSTMIAHSVAEYAVSLTGD